MFDRLFKSATAGLAVTAAVALAGCGSSGSSTTTGTQAAQTQSGGSGVNVAAAKAAVAQYSGKPTAFPADTPLKSKPTGKTFAYFQCSTPVCALFTQILQPTQKLLGYKLSVVKAGASANEVQGAMNSIISLNPAGVLLPASDPNQFLQQIKQLEQAKVPISANGILNPQNYGIQADFLNNYADALGGKLMADWAVANSGGGEIACTACPSCRSACPFAMRSMPRWQGSARRAPSVTSTSRSPPSARTRRTVSCPTCSRTRTRRPSRSSPPRPGPAFRRRSTPRG